MNWKDVFTMSARVVRRAQEDVMTPMIWADIPRKALPLYSVTVKDHPWVVSHLWLEDRIQHERPLACCSPQVISW